jgi:hypothetical protein
VIAAVVIAVVIAGLSGRAIEHDLNVSRGCLEEYSEKVMVDNTRILVIS